MAKRPEWFTHEPLRSVEGSGRFLVKSTCQRCGESFTTDIYKTALKDVMEKHDQNCRKAKAATKTEP